MATQRTVISFFVSVPVLSEQMTLTEPSVSMELSLRVMALRPARNSSTAATRMMPVSHLPNLFICLVSGVSRVSTSESMPLILPISVCWPVAVTTPTPCPPEIIELENAIDVRSPRSASSSTSSASISVQLPSRRTVASGESMSLSPSSAFSARPS